MRLPVTLSALIASALMPQPALGQEQHARRFGMHAATNVAETPLDLVRVGAQGLLPLRGRLQAYPAASIMFDRAAWQIAANVRFTPFRPSTEPAVFYVGGGASWIGWEWTRTRFYEVLLFGFEGGLGAYRPFVEMQLLDPISRLLGGGDFGPQLYVGLNAILP